MLYLPSLLVEQCFPANLFQPSSTLMKIILGPSMGSSSMTSGSSEICGYDRTERFSSQQPMIPLKASLVRIFTWSFVVGTGYLDLFQAQDIYVNMSKPALFLTSQIRSWRDLVCWARPWILQNGRLTTIVGQPLMQAQSLGGPCVRKRDSASPVASRASPWCSSSYPKLRMWGPNTTAIHSIHDLQFPLVLCATNNPPFVGATTMMLFSAMLSVMTALSRAKPTKTSSIAATKH